MLFGMPSLRIKLNHHQNKTNSFTLGSYWAGLEARLPNLCTKISAGGALAGLFFSGKGLTLVQWNVEMNETIMYRISSFLHSHVCQFRLLWKQSNTLERGKGNSVFFSFYILTQNIIISSIPTTLCNIVFFFIFALHGTNSCHNIWCTLVWLARCRIGPYRRWNARPRRLNLAFQTLHFKL